MKKTHNKRNVITVLICMLLLPLVMAVWADAAGSDAVKIELSGYGTQEYPYLVTDREDLDNLRDVINSGDSLVGKWVALTNDLDLEGAYIAPIADQAQGMFFQGGFDGRGHKIYNFTMDSGAEPASFFGRLDGVVENLYLDGSIYGGIAAGFANQGYGLVLNCISNCDITGAQMAAGIVNHWNGSVQNAVFCGSVYGPVIAGAVNSGNGIAAQVFCDSLEIGAIATEDTHGTIEEIGAEKVVAMLNDSAQSCFLTSEYGKWLNQWTWDGHEIGFSAEIAAFRGMGTKTNPFVIDSADKLQVMAAYLNAQYTFEGLYFYQTANIDLSNTPWIFLQKDSGTFSGTYDGNGFEIRGLDTGRSGGGLFRSFNGKILNLSLTDCNTPRGCGFAEVAADTSLIVNSYCDGTIGDIASLNTLMQMGQLVNCYIAGLTEPAAEELNTGLDGLVIYYGIHCGDLWTCLLYTSDAADD